MHIINKKLKNIEIYLLFLSAENVFIVNYVIKKYFKKYGKKTIYKAFGILRFS